SDVYKRQVQTSEAPPPVVRWREFRLPGLHKLGGVSSRLAALTGPDTTMYADAPVVLLDLRSGRHAVVREHAVGWKERFGVLGLKCSDSWVVWEELRGDERESPLECEWKLYAARVDAEKLAVGEPVLVAESITSIEGRPMFVVMGDEVFWMTNSAPNAKQEGTVRGARIKAKKLPDGAVRTVIESRRNFASMSESEGMLLVCELASKESSAETLLVVDPATGAIRRSLDLGNGEAEVSHLPKIHGDRAAWTVMPDSESSVTRLLVAAFSGDPAILEEGGADPVFVGPYLLYESLSAKRRPSSQGVEVRQRIRGYDPDTGEVFTLLESDADADGAWQLWMWSGYEPQRFVLTRKSLQGDASTIVRVGELGG
ncbi:MAG: hypothetical protein N3B11_07635, partial [Coriobacteriia bacterium]|nr:hypothetical protein [Coriobacteriia bacterium]